MSYFFEMEANCLPNGVTSSSSITAFRVTFRPFKYLLLIFRVLISQILNNNAG